MAQSMTGSRFIIFFSFLSQGLVLKWVGLIDGALCSWSEGRRVGEPSLQRILPFPALVPHGLSTALNISRLLTISSWSDSELSIVCALLTYLGTIDMISEPDGMIYSEARTIHVSGSFLKNVTDLKGRGH
jgi:hypothetical protein